MENNTQQGTSRNYLKISFFFALGLLLVFAGFWGYMFISKSEKSATLSSILKKQGYTPNVGFSGVFSPGNVVQVKEQGADGNEHSLVTPVVFLWSSDCFPGMTPKVDPYVLPQISGTRSASLNIGTKALSRFIPSLQTDNKAVIAYTLKVVNPHVHTFAKGIISGQFSQKCVQAYDRQIKAGDKPEWFAVIVDAIIADQLTLEIEWNANTSAEARAEATRQATGALSRIQKTTSAGDKSPEVSIRLKSEDKERTVIAAEGAVIIAYRARPLQREEGE